MCIMVAAEYVLRLRNVYPRPEAKKSDVSDRCLTALYEVERVSQLAGNRQLGLFYWN